MGARRRHQSGDAVYQLQRCECDLVDLGAPLVTGGLAALLGAAVDQIVALFAQALQGKGWARAVAQQPLKASAVVRLDAHTGIAARGTQIFVGGQIGWNAQQQFESDYFIAQTAQALRNIAAVLAEAGAGPQHMVRMTWYITDRVEYNARLKELGTVYREVMGRNFPAMTCVQVAALVEARAKVEIEVSAVLPD